jgi:LmbE family N-acetylglucosaminyl deacetylase
MNETILVIAAHPDDEVLGCGGTMARHVDDGDAVHVAILAEGITSRDSEVGDKAHDEELSTLARSAQAANDILGAKTLTMKHFPDNRMDEIARLDVVKVVEGLLEEYRPTTIYSHHCGDVNIDHRRIHDAVVTACRPQPSAQPVPTLLFFEVSSSTEWQPPGSAAPFVPNWFVDVTKTLDRKVEALKQYSSEMRDWPHARSIQAVEHLARWRGSTMGVEAAEAFELGRRLWK